MASINEVADSVRDGERGCRRSEDVQIKTAYKESALLHGERDNLDKRKIMYESDFKIRGAADQTGLMFGDWKVSKSPGTSKRQTR